MKATKEQLETVRNALASLDTDDLRRAYRGGHFPRANTCRDVSKRYRWDLFYLAIGSGTLTYDTLRNLNDEQTDTVLRRVVSPLFAN